MTDNTNSNAKTADRTRGTVSTIILKLLTRKPMYGYEMIQAVNERSNGYFVWREGSLYPILHRLEAEGFVVSEMRLAENGKPRRYYRLTPQGEKRCTAEVADAQAFCTALTALLA